MISAVRDGRLKNGDGKPEPSSRQVAFRNNHAHEERSYVRDDKFDWMAIDGDNADGRSPLVVCLMEMFVKTRVMKDSVGVIEAEFFYQDADSELDE